MLHLILGILKVIGIILLVILGFLLAGILALLFVPLRYRVSVKKEDDSSDKHTGSSGDLLSTIQGHAGVSWLLHLIGLSVDFVDKQLNIRFKIFGFTLKQFGGQAKPSEGHKNKIGARRRDTAKLKKTGKEKETGKTKDTEKKKYGGEEIDTGKAKEAEKAKDTEKVKVPDGVKAKEYGDITTIQKEKKPERLKQELPGTRIPGEAEKQEEDLPQKDGLVKRLLDRCFEIVNSVFEFVLSIPEMVLDLVWWGWDLFESGEDRVEKLQKKKDELMKKARPFLRDSSKKLYQKILLHLKRLWKHYRPTTAKGWLHYGTGAPDITGELTGLAYLVLPAAFDKLELRPDFTEAVIEGDVTLKGHIRAIWVVMTAVSLLLDKEFRRLIRIARGKQGGNKDGGQ